MMVICVIQVLFGVSNTHENTPRAMHMAKERYMKYPTNIDPPKIFVILHLLIAMMTMIAINIANNIRTEQNIPSESTFTIPLLSEKVPAAIPIIHGTGNLEGENVIKISSL